MPRRLPSRVRPHSIREFHAAATVRFRDATILAREGRRTAAVYLLGYVAEMVLKAAYFSAFGYDEDEEITRSDLEAARRLAPSVGLIWTGNLHNVSAWGNLLIRTRASIPGLSYSNATFASRVVSTAFRVSQVWTEVLRYHKNVAYAHELRIVMEAVEWLFVSQRDL